MPVYLDGEKKKKKDDVFLPYWLDVEKQRKAKLYNETSRMTGQEFVRRALWLCFCVAGAIAVGGRSCG